MTFDLLNKLIKQNDIPETVTLMSDSGWECDPTDMNGIYYNSEINTIVFTQDISNYDSYYKSDKWKALYLKK